MNTTSSNILVFIDSSVPGYETLIANLLPGTEVILLDSQRDGVEQIAEVLAEHSELGSIEIVSHSAEGSLTLGSTQLNNENLDAYAPLLQQWGEALVLEGDILLYSSNVAAGEAGQAFIQQLSEVTGADVAASEDLKGNAAHGGDLMLEAATDSIEASLAFHPSEIASLASTPSQPWTVRQISVSDNIIDNTTEATTILDNATGKGLLSIGTENYTIDVFTGETVDMIDYGGYKGNFTDTTNPYPDGTADTSFLVYAETKVTIPPGTYTIAFGSDDGGWLRLGDVNFTIGDINFTSAVSDITFTDTFGEKNHNGVNTNEIRYEAPRSYAWTGGTFNVTERTTTTLSALFFDKWFGDAFEIALAQGTHQAFDQNQFKLLKHETYEWNLSSTTPKRIFLKEASPSLLREAILLANNEELMPGRNVIDLSNISGTIALRVRLFSDDDEFELQFLLEKPNFVN